MALISLNPKNIYDIVALLAKEQQKYILVIDNSKYSDLTADQKTAVKAYYTDNDAEGNPQWMRYLLLKIYFISLIQNNRQLMFVTNGFLNQRIYQMSTIGSMHTW